MSRGQVTIPFNPAVISTGSKLVVIDTGNGLGAFEQSKGVVGQMNANMTAAGIDPKNVDIVVVSHLHGDQMNGLKKADGSLVYPHAEIMGAGAAYYQEGSRRAIEGLQRQRKRVHKVGGRQGFRAGSRFDRGARPHTGTHG